MTKAHSTYDRFCHEDIWLAQPIGIWHQAHYDIAQLLVKLVGMPLQVPEVGKVFTDMRIEIDPRIGIASSLPHPSLFRNTAS
jgi:hypothetical protein